MEPVWHKIIVKIKKKLGVNVSLCYSCKWNWRTTCHNPARPEVPWCPDYEKRGR